MLKPEAFLREQRALDPDGFASPFQQDPLSGGDALFPKDAWVYYAGGHPRVRQVSILVDSSFKDGVSSDPSAVAVWGKGLEDGHAYCLDVWKHQVGFTALLDEIRRVYAKWKHLRPAVWIEGKANGQAAIDSLRKASATVGPDGQAVIHEALPVREWKPQAGWGASKVARMEGEGRRNMVTVDVAGERTRLLTLSSSYSDAEDDADPAVWGMFAVTLPVPEAGLALLRRVVAAQAATPSSASTAACSTKSIHSCGSTQ